MTAPVPSRRRLQWAMAGLAAIPALSAVQEIARGVDGVPGGSSEVNPTVDSALRYASVFKLASSVVIWSQVGSVERSAAAPWSYAAVFAGGLARGLSWRQRGRPHPITIAAIGLELAAPPALVAWRRWIVARP